MSNDDISQRLEQIQAQLAELQSNYGGIARTYYNIFYNPEPMDVSLTLYNNDGELEEVTVPNRAKDASDKIYKTEGSPNGSLAAPLGALCYDTANRKLYFKTIMQGSSEEGWVEVVSSENFKPNVNYLPYTDGNGVNLTNLNANNINKGVLSMQFGGTGSTELKGILKGVPPVKDERGETIKPGYITTAEPGVDYTSLSSFTGMICFAPIESAPEGFLVCDGSKYRIKFYKELYDLLTRRRVSTGEYVNVKYYTSRTIQEDNEYAETHDIHDETQCYFVADDPATGEYDVEWFRVPNLLGYFPRFWGPNAANTVDTEPDRYVLSEQKDGVPNIRGQWAQEITGIPENYFTDAVEIPKQDDKPIQVEGKSSAPGGYYDYLIRFNAQNCSDRYIDDLPEVRVINKALLPIIKYAVSS